MLDNLQEHNCFSKELNVPLGKTKWWKEKAPHHKQHLQTSSEVLQVSRSQCTGFPWLCWAALRADRKSCRSQVISGTRDVVVSSGLSECPSFLEGKPNNFPLIRQQRLYAEEGHRTSGFISPMAYKIPWFRWLEKSSWHSMTWLDQVTNL